MNEVVRRIDELRKKKGLTKKELMTKMGVSPSTANSWFYSDISPTLSNIESACVALEVTTEQFFSGIGNENADSSEKKFVDACRMLTEPEKLAVEKFIAAFKATKAVKND